MNTYALDMLQKMESLAREKWGGWTVDLVKRWPPMSTIDYPCVIGQFVITSRQKQHRIMMQKNAIEFADTYCTPSDLARLYLNLKFKGARRRITTEQWNNFYAARRFTPLYCDPCHLEDACYVDIRGAYWSILRACGWDVDYNPGKWVKVRDDLTVEDFPFPQVKMSRNCLVSLAADGSRVMSLWTGKGIEYRKGGNPLVNKMLYAFVTDVLNGVASECIEEGARYAFTDGFICSVEHTDRLVQVIESWGLGASIKLRGECYVSGAGAYRFPDYQTQKFRTQGVRPINKIAPVSRDWLKKRFVHFALKHNVRGEFDLDAYEERKARHSI